MEKRKLIFFLAYKINNSLFLLLLLLIQIKVLFSKYFDTIITETLNEGASFVDITDYHNIYPIITTDKTIYTDIPPIKRNTTSSNITKFSAGATYDNETILIACTEDYLLSKIDIDSGEETSLVKYEDINVNMPNFTCSISLLNDYVYIGISHKIVPSYKIKIEKDYTQIQNSDIIGTNNISFDSIDNISDFLTDNNTEEDKYDIIYDYNNTYLESYAIKIKLKNFGEKNELIKDPDFNIQKYNFYDRPTDQLLMSLTNPLSCEIDSSSERLVCGYISFFNKTYLAKIAIINENFWYSDEDKMLTNSTNLLHLKLQKKDGKILYLLPQKSFIINLKNNGDRLNSTTSKPNNFESFDSNGNLFFYNNNFLFFASDNSIIIKSYNIDNYFAASQNNINKLIGYYKKEDDILLCLYRKGLTIKYLTIQNASILYQHQFEKKVLNLTSNTTEVYNLSKLVKSPSDYYFLTNQSLVYYISTSIKQESYDLFYFDEENQTLTVEPSLNDWITFSFYIKGRSGGISSGFYSDNAKLSVKTCLFKCGSCFESFDYCDNGTCKANFSLLSIETGKGEECFPNDQNYPSYLYNSTTKNFERCFNTCKFCSLYDKLSNQSNQNCKVCEDGYLRSYTFLGNCYAINSTLNSSKYLKIVNNTDDEEFEVVDYCPESKKYKIYETGECVESCPKPYIYYYYTYYKNTSFDIEKQEEESMGKLYPLTSESIPRYLFNGICYSSCPTLTRSDTTNNVCNCTYGWHYNFTTDKKICYDHKDYCLSLDYYYHTDYKECVLDDCKEGYFKMNFECYKQCPKNTTQIPGNRCESTKKYCFINETSYKTKCSDIKYVGYNYKYNNTKTYFKFCNESIEYFNITTYLYKNICHEYCPEETTKNDTNGRCSCNYYIYYVNEDRSDYICLLEKEKCTDKKRYNISEEEECVDTKKQCYNRGYFVFNYDCLTECPNNTEGIETEDEKNCYCKYDYYNKSNFLTCFDEGVTCENQNYPIKMSKKNNSNECFKTSNECINRGFKFFNNICYNSCSETPVNTTEKNRDGMCKCIYYYHNDTNILDCFNEGETCDEHSYNYTNIDTNECFASLEVCKRRNLKIFNNSCYNNCPANTIAKSGNYSCICRYYFYKENDDILNCFPSGKTCTTEGYPYTNPDTKECFKSEDECIERGYKIFNNLCYSNCPINTQIKNNPNKCECSSYYTKDENNMFTCFSSLSNCTSKNYYFNNDTKQCFISKEKCFNENKKIFGIQCLDSCPANSEIKGESNNCECSYNFFNDNGILNCFNNGETCESKGYLISSDDASSKECFLSIDDCIKKGYLYFFDKTCFKTDCPNDKKKLSTIDSSIKNEFIKDLHLNPTIADKLCICDTENKYHSWQLIEESGNYSQKCQLSCPSDYNIENTTKKCHYLCDPKVDFVFNNICYKNDCPAGTHLNKSNTSSRTCICEDDSKVDEKTGLTKCVDFFPRQYYYDRKNCPYVYKRECCFKCPENTCLATNIKDLSKCVDYKYTMKIYNEICIEGIDDLVKSIYYFEDINEIETIMTPSGVSLSAYCSDASLEVLMKKYPNLTYVNLATCKNKLLESYKLSPETRLYIIGIDMPNLIRDSSINSFNYEVYLKNGTQLEDLSPCDNSKIYISSYINDLDKVYYLKAIEFYKEGYDIYNRSNIFYVDNCAPAQDNGNDITLVDRAKYYYPKVLICNEGCKYNVIDFESQRFLCDCNSNLTYKEYKFDDIEKIEENEEDDSSYLDYFLSLINYKIILCMNLFFEFKSFYYNAGFYISFGTLLILLLLLGIFWIKGIEFIRIILYKNLPTKSMLKEILKNKNKEEKPKNNINKDYKDNQNKQDLVKRRNRRRNKTSKTIKSNIRLSLFLNNKNNPNPPPKGNNLRKYDQYLQEIRLEGPLDLNNNKEDNFSDFNKENNIEIFKENKKIERKSKKYRTRRSERKSLIKEGVNPDTLSSKDNLLKFNSNINIPFVNEKEYENKPGNNFFKKEIEERIDNNNYIEEYNNINNNNYNYNGNDNYINNNINYYIEKKNYNENNNFFEKNHNFFENKYFEKKNYFENKNDIGSNNLRRSRKRKSTKRSSKLSIKNIDNKEDNSNKLAKDLRGKTKEKSLRKNKKRKTAMINRNKIEMNLNNEEVKKDNTNIERGSTQLINIKKEMRYETELVMDFNYEHLIDIKDDEVDKREINGVPFRQALRIDKRSICQILVSVFINEIGFLNLFLYRNPYSHLSLSISIYLFELLLDLTMNCFLYTDDVVSEKYHNNGELSMLTSLSLSFISNIISSIIVFIISKLTNYVDIIEAIIKDVKNKKIYIENINRLFKYIKIRLGLFYFFQLGFTVIMTYYLFIFCTVYHQSQGSIMLNYIIGALTSFGISCGLTIIITFLRIFSIKYRITILYNISRYLYDHS